MDETSEGETRKEEGASDEEMEEDKEVRTEESMEDDSQDRPEVSPEGSDIEDESGLLEPDTEEEGEEDEEEVEEKRAEELLGEDDEAGGEEEEIEVELDVDDVGEEVLTFEKTEDHLDSKPLNKSPSISDLEINSPKDSPEPDNEIFDETSTAETSNAAKSFTGSSKTVTKSLTGSAETGQTNTPLSKPNDIDMTATKEGQEMQEKVERGKEDKGRGRKEKKGRAESRSSSTTGAAMYGATDVRCKEVKSDNLPEITKKSHDLYNLCKSELA